MFRNICTILMIVALKSSLFCSRVVTLNSQADYVIGQSSRVDFEANYGTLQLSSLINVNDAFDLAPKAAVWSGSYSAISSEVVRNAPSSLFSSPIFPLSRDFDAEVKVSVGSFRQAGIFLSGPISQGIWLFNNLSGTYVRSSFSVAQSSSNGIYLRLKKEGNVLAAFWRESKTVSWHSSGSASVTQVAGILGLGYAGSFETGISVGQGDFSELSVKPFEPVGNWTSAPIDLTVAPTTIGKLSWTQQLPVGTRIELQTSTSEDAISWSNWSTAYTDNFGSQITSPSRRYIRVGVNLYADVTGQSTPVLDAIRIEYPDATPLGPVITPQSHPAALWASPSTVSLLWAMPAGNPAPEESYAYWLRLNGNLTATASLAVTEAPGATHPFSLPLPAEGSYTLDLKVTGDTTSGGRTASAQTYSFGYDGTAPSQTDITSPTHPALLFTNNRNPVFHLAAADSVSGVSGYAAVLDKAPTGDPGSAVNAGQDLRFSSLDNGTWYLHARAIDKAGNTGPVSHYGIRIDFNGQLISPDYVKAMPNPVRSDVANLEYELAAPATEVTLEFLNSQGELLKSVDGTRAVGKNGYHWELGGLANGVYLFRVKARSAEDGKTYTVVRKVAVIR